jgi:type II secretory pathway component PulM
MNARRIAVVSSITRFMARTLEPLKQWYSGLQAREQFLVSRGAVAAVALLLIGGLLQLQAAVSKAQAAVVRKQDDLAYIISHLGELQGANGTSPDLSSPLASIVERTANDSGLGGQLKSNQPEGDNSLRVKFEGASFDTLVLWVSSLQQEQGIQVQSATIDRAAVGTVVATLVLARQ